MLVRGDKVKVSNVDLASYGAIGTVVTVYTRTVRVNLDKLPTFYNGNKLVKYSFDSVEHCESQPVKKSSSSNIALFFDTRVDAEEFLDTGKFYSENGCFDIVSAETLKDCEEFYEGLDAEFKEEVEVMVFKGVLYEVKTKAVFEEVED